MWAYTVATTGGWASNVAAAVYVFEQTRSPAWLGAATVARFVPALLFSAYGGVLADRFERIRLMVGCDLLSALLVGLMAAVAAVSGSVVLIIGLGMIGSLIMTVYEPALAAMTPQLVPEDDLAGANSLRGVIDNLTVIVGPALAGAVLIVASPAAVYAVTTVTFLFSAVMIRSVRTRSRPVDVTEGGSAGPLAQMMVGLRAIGSSAGVAVLVAFSVIASFVYGVDTVQFVVLSEERLGTGANGYGYLLAGLGVGGVLMAGVVNRLAAWSRLSTVMLLGMAAYCLPTAAFLVVDQPAVAFGLQVVRGAGTMVVDILAMTALQRALPEDVLARVFGAYFGLVIGAIALGALVTPGMIEIVGLDASLWFAGVALPASCLLGLPWLREMDRASVERLATLRPRIELLERTQILTSLGRPALERLAAAATDVRLPAGERVVEEGGVADALYVIGEGEVVVSARGGPAADRQLPSMGPGDYFGEIGLIEQIPRTATVTTTTAVQLLRVDGEQFLSALTEVTTPSSVHEVSRFRLARTHPSHRALTNPA